jgi:primosomal protein N' (replication factor Y)
MAETIEYYEVAPNRIIRADSDVLTYYSSQPLQPGDIVTMEVGARELIGVVVRRVGRPSFETKPIATRLEGQIPEPLLQTTLWMSTYYATPLATVLGLVLPRGLLKNRRQNEEFNRDGSQNRTKNVLNKFQAQAVEHISDIVGGTALLHGVTGSGKTLVYIELARKALEAGRSSIILVPEIALTSQVVDEFAAHFEHVIITHSNLTEAQRHKIWNEVANATSPQVIVGPRSALFLPVTNLGLIVLDEAHEPSYKQESSPRYSALRAASTLGAHDRARVVFGSATPLVTDYFLAESTGKLIVTLPQKARAGTREPDVTLVDMTKRTGFKRHRFLSDALLGELDQTAPHARQSLVFHNRRGSASTTLCENCGWVAIDPVTAIPLTLHADTYELRSHISDFTMRVPSSCPICGHADIIHKGIGTKLIESELKRLYPNKSIIRFDGDNTKDETLNHLYDKIYAADFEIIIGTQVVAKGLDLPFLRSVGVIQADAGLNLPDYGNRERTFDLLAQVMGRVGRTEHASHVIVQSFQPNHPAVRFGIAQDYTGFYADEITARRASGFPPFSYLLRLTCMYKTEAATVRNARKLQAILRANAASDVQILGPAPAFYEYQAGSYRWQLTLRARTRQHLLDLLTLIPPTHWQFELDPTGLT